MPLVVTRLSAGSVEVWGQVRPATGRTRPVVEIAGRSAVVGRPLTNSTGYYRFVVRRARAARLRYRASWTDPAGETFSSRVASPGRAIEYHE
jgi:hypothetical protein